MELTVEGLVDQFIEENQEKLDCWKKDNKEYVEWYAGMLKQLEEVELPYAYGEYFHHHIIVKPLMEKESQHYPTKNDTTSTTDAKGKNLKGSLLKLIPNKQESKTKTLNKLQRDE